MMEEMERGLAGEKSSLPMIPTYLSDDGAIPRDTPAVVIDAGGTNFRRALITFDDSGYTVDSLSKRKMPGIDRPATWEEFVSFTADSILPLMDKAEKVGFCFSFTADVTPEIDGRVRRIDKEVVITGCEGQLVAASLKAELERRGVLGKKIVILNDTVAVLLGGLAAVRRSDYSGFVGQVSGTGTNTCCSLPAGRIGKLGLGSDRSMIVNLESGMYDGIRGGDFDRILDEESHNPGEKRFEKLTAGVYLGELCHLMLKAAADEGLLSPEASERVRAMGWIDSAVIDAWASGEQLEQICGNVDDEAFVEEICRAMFERSARCMCTNLAAILLLTGAGKSAEKPACICAKSAEKPACICAEGSLVQKGRAYRPVLEQLLRDEVGGKLGLFAEYRIGNETTLPGSAAAALLN